MYEKRHRSAHQKIKSINQFVSYMMAHYTMLHTRLH